MNDTRRKGNEMVERAGLFQGTPTTAFGDGPVEPAARTDRLARAAGPRPTLPARTTARRRRVREV
jgi:hypothetical protein